PIKLGDSADGHSYAEEGEEHLPPAVFNIEESDTEGITECVGGIYPALDETLEQYHGEDGTVTQAHGGARESTYNYEWVDSIDDVIHVLNGCPDIPMALQVSTIRPKRVKLGGNVMCGGCSSSPKQDMAANFGCQEMDVYANLIGLNSFCKTRWTGNQNQITSGTSSPVEEDTGMVTLSDPTFAYRTGQTAGQLLALDPQQFSMESIQLLNQLHQASVSQASASGSVLHHPPAANSGGAPGQQPKLVNQTATANTGSGKLGGGGGAGGGGTGKKGEKNRKEKNRLAAVPAVRQAPAGQQSVGGAAAAGGQLQNYQYDNGGGTNGNARSVGGAMDIPPPGGTVQPFHGAGSGMMPPQAGGSTVVSERTIDVDSETDSNHDTALTLACAGGHEDMVELLITRGANIEHKDKKGFTPLILAATAGHEKVVDTLLRNGAEIEAQSERTKDTPLSLACSGGRYEVVELLLSMNANREHRNVSDYTPLSLAASGGYVNIIKLLLQHGAEINSRTGSKLGISPLMLAAMNGHVAAVKLLLDMGSDINAQIETNRNTALTLACFQGRHEVVSLLLDRKANVEHRAKTGLTPLMEAASGGYIDVGRVLLDKGADVNAAPVPSSRDTALTIAADKGHLKFVELLLSRGALVEVKNKKGNSPLWLAANGGHLGVVELLCSSGGDIDSQDNRKVSCLMAAFRKGHTKVVKWMVGQVTQFPSDQEMTRYINTISEQELLEKCHDCVKVIRAAKDQQATKANINASILLKELDLERSREESRKAAAAKRRERKKRRRAEKREQQRKLEMGEDGEADGNDDDDEEEEAEDEKEEEEEEEEEEDVDSEHDEDELLLSAAMTQQAAINSSKNKNLKSSSTSNNNALEQKKNNKKRKQQQQQQQQQAQTARGTIASTNAAGAARAAKAAAVANASNGGKSSNNAPHHQQSSGNTNSRQSKSPEAGTAASSSGNTVVQDKNSKEKNRRQQEKEQQYGGVVREKREKATLEKENVAPKDHHDRSS
uniref:ANK_REP_REGION domain-containing protein n=1 Tax=Anopheles maculatus TaxID=74869 RepID=A0A182STW8_9DIPT